MNRVSFPLAMFVLFNVSCPVSAQISSDGTLNTTVTSSDARNFTITNGRVVGNHLFHSFDRFSIPTQGSATFDLTNTGNISTIFGRVTGGDVSSLDGVIQSTTPVSLFLINPNGILLGANARLNLAGSFIGTTANSVKFADGTEFGAVSSPPLLTMSAPVGLQFGANPGNINVQGTGHQLQRRPMDLVESLPFLRSPISGFQGGLGQTIALIGGDVTFNSGIVAAEQGHLAIASVKSPDLVRLSPTAQGYDFNLDQVAQLGNLQLTGTSLLDVSGSSAGSMHLQARQISVQNGSVALLQNSGTLPGGALRVIASERVTVQGASANQQTKSGFYSETLNGAGGELLFKTPELLLLQGGRINSKTAFGSGNGGAITINVDRLQVMGDARNANGPSGIAALTIGDGRAGSISVFANQVELVAGVLSTLTRSHQPAGDIRLDAKEIVLSGIEGSQISNVSSISWGTGSAGNVRVNTQTLAMEKGAAIGTGTFSGGSAGSVEVKASEWIDLTGTNLVGNGIGRVPTRIDSSVLSLFNTRNVLQGNSGSVVIHTPQLRVADGAEIAVKNQGSGNGGTIEVNSDRIRLESGGSLTASTLSGSGGDIVVTARDSLLMRDRAQIRTDSQGDKKGGNITITAPLILGVNNSDIIANAFAGRGGDISITTEALFGLQFRNLLNPAATPTNDISARSRFNLSGDVKITTPGVEPKPNLVTFTQSILDSEQEIATGCAVQQGNQFIMTGRGGIPEGPTQELIRTQPWVDLRQFDRAISSPGPSPISPFVEATTWHRNSNGKIELMAARPFAIAQKTTCATQR